MNDLHFYFFFQTNKQLRRLASSNIENYIWKQRIRSELYMYDGSIYPLKFGYVTHRSTLQVLKVSIKALVRAIICAILSADSNLSYPGTSCHI